LPGGGKFADAVRKLDSELNLPAQVSHDMAILAMDQYGLSLSHKIPKSRCVESIADAQKLMNSGKTPIFLPSKLLFEEKPFMPSWDITSDSIAAYIAVKMDSKKLILVTDVDGICTLDPKVESSAKLLTQISIKDLLKLNNRTSVDKFLPRFLIKHPLECYVVNGKKPKRIIDILADKKSVCTHIILK
jgi:5-(aminomethyl)-3-furanmethanol phosphate kinase